MESITESDNKGLREASPRLELMMLKDLKCQDPSALHQLSITALQKSCTFALATFHAIRSQGGLAAPWSFASYVQNTNLNLFDLSRL